MAAVHQIDHIIAEKHDGRTVQENLALACYACNSFKGPNIAGVDPATGAVTRLFHPREDSWNVHFRWDGPRLVGITSIGRATVAVLRINLAIRVEQRRALIDEGVFLA